MDNMSYRSNRQAQSQPAEAKAPAATESPAQDADHSSSRTSRKSKGTKGSKPSLKLIIAALIVVVLALGAWYFLSRSSSVAGNIESSKIQAVFFTNGQVYFGKLKVLNSDYMKLTDIYYLQAKTAGKDNPQETSSGNSSDVQLIKLGDEIHGPEDAMVFNKDQVLFFENLKSDGNVSKTISNYQDQNN